MNASSSVRAVAARKKVTPGERSTQRKKKHGRVQGPKEFVSSCHVLPFGETPTGGGQTCVGPAPTLPACLLPLHPSSRPSIDASIRRLSFIFPELRKCWPDQDQAQLSDQTRLMATRPRFQRAQTPECFLMSDASLSRSLSPRRTLSLPFPSSLMSHHETHRNFGLFRVSEP